ncbi:hypothetical protein N3K66_001904 [Trichothecium roseum]|uniref:Uncharacterized protein n=1 Tax=Trichothecium roseum TaxID=47278 RepID=A0ACC0V827_9HYPO|nr:hypothetical protein N3K66_001904 [Trichothecium roseum]
MSYRARRTDQPNPYAYENANLPRPETMNQESLAPGRRGDDHGYDYDSVSSSDYGEDEQQPATHKAQHRHGMTAQAPPPGDEAYYYDANNRRRRRQHHHQQQQQQQQQQGGEKSYAGVRDDMLGSGGTGGYQQRQQQRRAGDYGGISFDDDDGEAGRRQRGTTQENSAMRVQGEGGGGGGGGGGERDAAYSYDGGPNLQEDPNAHYTTNPTTITAATTASATQAEDQQYGAHEMRPRAGYSEAGGGAAGPARTGMNTTTNTTGSSAAGVGGVGSDPGPRRRSKRDSTLGRMMEKAGGLFGSQKLEGSGRERREKRASREY